MTTPDIAGLPVRAYAYKEKGDRAWTVSLRMPEQGSGHWDVEPLVSGPKAADTLERQAAENKRLRVALERIADPRNIHFAGDAQVVARAALTGEDAAGLPTSQNTEPGLAFSDAGEP